MARSCVPLQATTAQESRVQQDQSHLFAWEDIPKALFLRDTACLPVVPVEAWIDVVTSQAGARSRISFCLAMFFVSFDQVLRRYNHKGPYETTADAIAELGTLPQTVRAANTAPNYTTQHRKGPRLAWRVETVCVAKTIVPPTGAAEGGAVYMRLRALGPVFSEHEKTLCKVCPVEFIGVAKR